MTDPDAGDGPDRAWFESELRACRARIAELEAENARMRSALWPSQVNVAAAFAAIPAIEPDDDGR